MLWYLLILLGLIGADQGLKAWVCAHLAVGQSAPLLPGVVQLTRLHNYGAAFSSLSGIWIRPFKTSSEIRNNIHLRYS